MTANTPPSRLSSIDLLRGLVMIIMALDHTRDFLSGATFQPTDLTQTNALMFFTRWITHFCAPIFVLLTGAGAYLSLANGRKTLPELSVFLFQRGLWLIFLEIAVISPFGWAFSLDFAFTRLQVIWVIGLSLLLLAVLIQIFPPRIIAALGLAMILLHNLGDGLQNPVWKALHGFSFFPVAPHKMFASLYPLIPWLGVMMLGYGAASIAQLEPLRRRQTLLRTGLAMLAAFAIFRGLNIYGDPKPWTTQKDPLFTLLSILNTNKYPPSLAYLLMTLGPAMLILAYADKLPQRIQSVLITFGRVPLFYYLLHLPLLHGTAVLFSYLRHGAAAWMFQDFMAMRNSPHPLPPGYGYDLWVVYLMWIAAVVALHPACRWFGELKRRNKHPLLSYF